MGRLCPAGFLTHTLTKDQTDEDTSLLSLYLFIGGIIHHILPQSGIETPPLFSCVLPFSSPSALKRNYVCWSVCMMEEDRGAETNDSIIIPAALLKSKTVKRLKYLQKCTPLRRV